MPSKSSGEVRIDDHREPGRAGSGVKGGPAILAGPFIDRPLTPRTARAHFTRTKRQLRLNEEFGSNLLVIFFKELLATIHQGSPCKSLGHFSSTQPSLRSKPRVMTP